MKGIFLLFLFTCLAFGSARAQIANNVVISEVYGGGGNVGAPYSHDFIELYNPTAADIVMTNWSVQYAGADGTSWSKTNIPAGTIKAKSYFLVRASSGNGNVAITNFDVSGSLSLSALRGKVVLSNSDVLLTGANPTGAAVVDKVGWGTGPLPTGYEGSVGPATTTTNSIERKANTYSTSASMAAGGSDDTQGNGFDSNDNGFDFVNSAVPVPQYSGSASEALTVTVPATAAPTVQTSTASSIRAITATANGNVTANGGSKLTERGFVYLASTTDVTPTLETAGVTIKKSTASATAPIQTGAFSESLTGLLDNTNYYIRSFATNAAGTAYGEVQQFTTIASSQLSELYISAGMLAPVFSPATLAYTATVDNSIAFVDVVPTFANPAATATINGATVTSGSGANNFPLAVGENSIAIVVTAPDGIVTTTYNLTITRTAAPSTMGMADHLVISEIYAGSGESGPYTHDFVELYNPTDAPISVGGWSMQVASATGSTWIKTALPSKVIPAKGYFLFQGATVTGAPGVGVGVFDDNLGTFAFASSGGKIVLVNNNILLTVANPVGPQVVDKIAWGNATTGFEGAAAPAFTATSSLERKAVATSTAATMAADGSDATRGNGYDSNNNSFDFVVSATPSIQNLVSPLEGEIAPTTTTAAATAITPNSATLNGNVTGTGGSPVTERGFVYMASTTDVTPAIGMEGVTKVANATAGTGAFTSVLTSLPVMTKYYARAYAINSYGTSYGSVISFTTPASDNANLSGLVTSEGTLTPAFDAATTSYTLAVANGTSSLTLTPTVADANATVMVNGTAVTSGSVSSAIALNVGANTITTVVTAQNGTTAKTYTITATRAASTNANLSGLVLSAGTLSPVFDAGTLSYKAMVSSTTESITVTPALADASAVVTVNGVAVTSGSASAAIPLKVGDNTITAVVTAQDGTTSKTYTTTVNRAMTNHLVISEVYGGAGNTGALFKSDYIELYNPTDQDIVMNNWSVQFAVAGSATWTMHTISGTVKAKGYFLVKELTSSGAADLPTPDASGTLNIGGFRGKVALSNTNTLLAVANPSDASIVDLLGWGEPNAAGTTAGASGFEGYRAANTSELTALERKANNFSTTASLATGGADELQGNGFDSNNNNFDFVLVTPNPQNSSAPLEMLTNELTAPVAPAVTTTAPAAITSTTATLAGEVTAVGGAQVTERGVVYVASATAVEPTIGTANHVKVASTVPGLGVFTLPVTGLSFNTKYYVRAYATNEVGTSYGAVQEFTTAAASTNANLSAFTISAGTLTPAFDAATVAYTASLPFATSSITVRPTVADATATVTVNGTTVASGAASSAIALNVGANTITTVVTAQDGTTAKTYTVVVTRAAAATNANLAGLALSAGTLSPAFDAATMSYTANVGFSRPTITVTPTTADATATVMVNGTAVASGAASPEIALEVGTNTITVAVMAQDGTTAKSYSIVVTRATLTSIGDLAAQPTSVAVSAVYPNPVQDQAAVKFGLPKASSVKVQVVTMAGAQVLEKNLGTFAAGTHDATWLTAADALAPGVYLLRVVTNNGTASVRFVVTR
ncbi:cadherin-like beta sandwich domain-containing protein [Rufibacter sp. LB8]|nr:cadherin-like beta sandwich domain-containing protein [Rufibacter sp. LB8]